MKNSEFSINTGIEKAGDDENLSMRMYDYCAPPLLAGTYTIDTTQNVKWPEKSLNQTFDKKQQFAVDGARFSMSSSWVYSIFPPATKRGNYDNYLPHIVVKKKSLPWERTIDGKDATDEHEPWLALLLFNAADGKDVGKPKNATVADILSPPANTLGPALIDKATIDGTQACLVVDVPKDIFSAIVPARNELKYLAHSREVDMADKELRNDVEDGWFSVIVGNRFPTAGTDPDGQLHYACLVSLEGFADYLYGAKPISATFNTVRMAVMAGWSFTSLPRTGETFGSLVQNINACSLHMPAPKTAATEAEKLVADAFHDGYVALNYLTRQGEKTAAWYRGPFTPVKRPFRKPGPFFSSEAGMIYDPKTGLFDVSYAVAWQIGRLLALSDAEFAVELMKWKKGEKVRQNTALEQQGTLQRLGLLDKNQEGLFQHAVEKDIPGLIKTYLTTDFAPLMMDTPDSAPFIALANPAGSEARVGQLPGLLSKQQVAELISHGPQMKERLKEMFDEIATEGGKK